MKTIMCLLIVLAIFSVTIVSPLVGAQGVEVYELSYPWYKLEFLVDPYYPEHVRINVTYPTEVDTTIPILLDETYLRMTFQRYMIPDEEDLIGVNITGRVLQKDYVAGDNPRVEMTAEYRWDRGGYVESKISWGDQVLRYIKINVSRVSLSDNLCLQLNGTQVCGVKYVEGRAVLYGSDFEGLTLENLKKGFANLASVELSLIFPLLPYAYMPEEASVPELKDLFQLRIDHVELYGDKYYVDFTAMMCADQPDILTYRVAEVEHESYTVESGINDTMRSHIITYSWNIKVSYYVPEKALEWLHHAYEVWAETVKEIGRKYNAVTWDYKREYVEKALPLEARIVNYLSLFQLPPINGPSDPFLWLTILEMMRNRNIEGFNVTVDYSLEDIQPIPPVKCESQPCDAMNEWLSEVAKEAPRRTTVVKFIISRTEDYGRPYAGYLAVLSAFFASLYGYPYSEIANNAFSAPATEIFAPTPPELGEYSERYIAQTPYGPVYMSTLYSIAFSIPILTDTIRNTCYVYIEAGYEPPIAEIDGNVCVFGREQHIDPAWAADIIYEMLNTEVATPTETTTLTPTGSETWTPSPTETWTPQSPQTTTTQPPQNTSSCQTPTTSVVAPETTTPITTVSDILIYGATTGIIIITIILIVVIKKWKK